MLKILVVSDTHGEIYRVGKLISRMKDIDLLIHLGDYARDALKLAEANKGLWVEYVYGNCDYTSDRSLEEDTSGRR